MEYKIVSPCISICKTDPVTGFCYGCARTIDEKKIWKNESTSSEWKLKNLSLAGINLGRQYFTQFSALMGQHEENIDLVLDNWQ